MFVNCTDRQTVQDIYLDLDFGFRLFILSIQHFTNTQEHNKFMHENRAKHKKCRRTGEFKKGYIL